MAIRVAPKATQILKVDRNQQFWISKPRLPGTLETRPEFGQIIEASSALGATDTELQVFPLIEPLKPNSTLDFGGTTIATTVAAGKDDTVIKVVAGSTLTAGAKAVTNGIEQIVTLAADAAVGDRIITVGALDESVEKGRTLGFATSGVSVKTVRAAEAGETTLYVEAIKLGTTAAGVTVITTGDTASLEEYVLVCSANSVQRTGNAQMLTDYVFCSGQDALKDVTTRDRNFQVSGLHVPGDFGLERVQQIITNEGAKFWFISSDKDGGFQWSANAVLGADGATTAVNQFKQVNFTVEVNGELNRYDYPHAINY